MPAPLVPRARVVARVVAGSAQGERRERGARAGVAVRDDLGAVGRTDELADPLRREQAVPPARRATPPARASRPGCGPAAGRTALPRLPVYSSSRRTSRIVSAGSSSRAASSCRVGSARGSGSSDASSHRLELDGALRELARPARRGRRAGSTTRGCPASSAICAAGIAPTPSPRSTSTSRSSPVMPWRRSRSATSFASSATASPSVPGGGEPSTSGREPGMCPRACAFGPRTSPTTTSPSPRCAASHDGVDDARSVRALQRRRPPARPTGASTVSRSSHDESAGNASSGTPSMSRARSTHGNVGDVREPVLLPAEPRARGERCVELRRAPRRSARRRRPRRGEARSTGRVKSSCRKIHSRASARSAGSAGEQRRLRIALLEVLHDHGRLGEDRTRPPRAPARCPSGFFS